MPNRGLLLSMTCALHWRVCTEYPRNHTEQNPATASVSCLSILLLLYLTHCCEMSTISKINSHRIPTASPERFSIPCCCLATWWGERNRIQKAASSGGSVRIVERVDDSTWPEVEWTPIHCPQMEYMYNVTSEHSQRNAWMCRFLVYSLSRQRSMKWEGTVSEKNPSTSYTLNLLVALVSPDV